MTLVISLPVGRSQDISEFETRIEWLLEQSQGYENTENILNLIRWDSDLPKCLPSISPLEDPDFRKIIISSGYGERIHPITKITSIIQE